MTPTPQGQDPGNHARRRADERFGLELTDADAAALCIRLASRACQPQDGVVLLHREDSGRLHYAAWHRGEWLPVVFDPERCKLVTVLPAHALRRHKGKLPW